MRPWQYLLTALLLAVLLAVLRISWIRRRKREERDFTRRLETLLLPREQVKVVCPGRRGRWVLTSTRLLLEEGEGFLAIPFRKIKSLRGTDGTGKTTMSVAKMTSLTVKTDSEHTLQNTSPEFPRLARELKARTARRKKQTAGKKAPSRKSGSP